MEHNHETPEMDRRQALKRLSLVFSTMPLFNGLSVEAVLAQGQAIHNQVAHKTTGPSLGSPVFLNPHQSETVAVISELIIPQTTTPGARAAKVHQFIDLFLGSMTLAVQEEFLKGLTWIDQRSTELHQKVFIETTRQEQTELLTKISTDDSNEDEVGKNFFKRIKDLTVFGYYTSKEGMEQELGYQGPTYPGVYEGCTHPEHQA